MEKFPLGLAALAGVAGCALAPSGRTERAKIPTLAEATAVEAAPPSIDLYLRIPEGRGPFPAVIYLHGCGGLEWRFADAAADNYLAMGYAVAVLDSLAPRGVMNVCRPGAWNVSPLMRAFDAHAALAYLSGRPEVDPKRIYLHGESHGGDTVIAALGANFTRDFLPDRTLRFAGGIAYYPYCGNLSGPASPLLILAGGRDDWTPGSYCREIADRLSGPHAPVQVVVYPDAYHAFNHQLGDVIYLGHALSYDAAATADSLKQIAAFLKATQTQPAQ
jgi:dienelactone hydrolase